MAEAKRKTKLRKRRKAVKEVEPVIEVQETVDEAPPDRIPETPLQPEATLETTEAQPQDRMMRYGRNPRCPKCDAHPVICMVRRPRYKKFRCRVCGHRWEVFE